MQSQVVYALDINERGKKLKCPRFNSLSIHIKFPYLHLESAGKMLAITGPVFPFLNMQTRKCFGCIVNKMFNLESILNIFTFMSCR